MAAAAARPESTAVAKHEAKAPEVLRGQLMKYAPRMALVLPKHITPDRLVTLALVAAVKSPDLFKCTPESIALSLMKISQWGLEIGETAHLVPFGTACTAIADWKGLVQMAIESRHVRDVVARAVYEDDHFEYELGLNERLVHRPTYSDKKRTPVAFYAIARLRGGDSTFEVMTALEVEAIRQAARSKNSPAWTGHFAEMGKKTAVRRLLKRMPRLPAHLRTMIDGDDEIPEAEVTALPAKRRPPTTGYGDDVTGPIPQLSAPELAAMANGPDPYAERVDEQTGEVYQDDRDIAGE